MKRLHLFIFKSYLGPLFITFAVSLFVLLMQFLWLYIDEMVGKGLELSVLMQLMIFASATFIPMALPLAILLSSIMTFGNLGEHYELVAMKASGISLQRIMYPLIIVSVMISVGAFFFSNYFLPFATLKFQALLWDVRQQRPEISIKEGAFNNDIDNYSIRVGRKDNKTNLLYNILIYDHKNKLGNLIVIHADSGKMNFSKDKSYLILTLYSGAKYEELIHEDNNDINKKTYPHQKDKFDEEKIMIELVGFGFGKTDENLFKDHYKMLNLKQLTEVKDSLTLLMNKKKDIIAKDLLTQGYFKNLRIRDSTAFYPIKDSLKLIKIDSIFKAFDKPSKLQIVQIASNFARSLQGSIINNKEEMIDREKMITRHLIEWHRKLSLSFACLILFFIGAPLGAIIRKGGLGMPIVISVLFFILFYIISVTGEKFAREGVLPAYGGMWLSSIILLPIGIFLTYKAANDSMILDIDTYINFFKRLVIKKKPTK